MKKNKSYILKLTGVFFFIMFFVALSSVYAGETKFNQNYVPNYFHAHQSGNSYSRYGQMASWSTSSGEISYCIEPGATFSSSVTYTTYSHDENDLINMINNSTANSANKINQEQLDLIKLIASYGYGYENHNTTAYRMATQMLIWRVVDTNQVFTNLNCTVHDCRAVSDEEVGVADEMSEIMALVNSHDLRPSFNGTTLNLKIGETVSLTDERNVLGNFIVQSCDNCSATISGNTLQLTATNIGNFTLRLSKKVSTNYNSAMLFAVSSSSQNQVVVGSIDPIISSISGTTTGGSVEVYKTDNDTNEPLDNITFKVYKDNQEVCEMTTNSNGYAKCDNLGNGTFTLVEIQTKTGYVLDSTSRNFNIDSNNTNVTFNITNKKITGSLELKKVDKDTGSVPQGDASFENAVYGIYKTNGELLTTISTNKDGYASIDNIYYGDYYLQEITSSSGYNLDSQKYYFSITQNNQVIQLTSHEPIKKFDFNLVKVMTDGTTGVIQTEENAVFDIILKSSKEIVATITTDDKGYASVSLPVGKYEVCQTDGDAGSMIADCFDIEITNDDIYRVVNNGVIQARLKVLKIDSETQELIPIAGIQFKIKNLDTNEYVCQTTDVVQCVFETNDDGVLITPLPLNSGNYQLEEVDQKVDGYLWNNVTIEFSINSSSNLTYDDVYGSIITLEFPNERVKGEIIINKYFEDSPLSTPNVKFGLYANEDIYFNNVLQYSKDELVTTIEVTNGKAIVSNLYLGNYYVKELSIDDESYVLDSNIYYISLNYIDQYTPIVSFTLDIENKLKRGNLEILKVDAETNSPLSSVSFSIYDMNDILVSEITTNEDGFAYLEDIKYGKYYILESKTQEGYILNTEKVYFEIVDDNQTIKIEMNNTPITGDLQILKIDSETKQSLSNVLFSIYDMNDTLIAEVTTNEAGFAYLEDIKYGKYYILESKTQEGYVLNSDRVYFEVTDNSQIIEVEMENTPIYGKLEFLKIDSETQEALAGVHIEIYNMTDELIYSGITDELGRLEVILKYGSYYLIEKEALDGYDLRDEAIYFDISEQDQVISLTMENTKTVIDVPITESNQSYFLEIACISIILIAGGILFYESKNRNKK